VAVWAVESEAETETDAETEAVSLSVPVSASVSVESAVDVFKAAFATALPEDADPASPSLKLRLTSAVVDVFVTLGTASALA